MTAPTAHIEECEREHVAALSSNAFLDSLESELENARIRFGRAYETRIRGRLHVYGVPCPVEACEDGHITLDELPATMTSPAELITEGCTFCEMRGSVLPAQAEDYQGD